MHKILLFLLINISCLNHINATDKAFKNGGFKQNISCITVDEINKSDGFDMQLSTTVLDDLDYPYQIMLNDNMIHNNDEVLAQNDILLSQQTLKDDSKYYLFNNHCHSHPYYIICRKGMIYNALSDLHNNTVIVSQDINMDNLITFHSGISNLKSSSVSKDLDLAMENNHQTTDGRYQEDYDKCLGAKQSFLNNNDLYFLFFGVLFFLILFVVLYWFMYRRLFKATHEVIVAKNQIEGMNCLINMLNKKIGTEIFINDAHEKRVYHFRDGGFTPYALNYEGFIDRVHPDDLAAFLDGHKKFITHQEKEFSCSMRIFRKSLNKYCHYNIILYPLKLDQNNHVYKYICLFHNDTQQQELIRNQDELIHTMNMAMSSSKLVRWHFDFSTNLFNYTDIYLNDHVLTPEEARGLTVPESEKKMRSTIDKVLKERKTQRIQIWQKYSCDDKFKLYEMSCMANFDKDDHPISVYGISRDISEIHYYQNQLEEKIELLETIKNNMPVGMYIYDRNGVLTDVNDTMLRFIGLDRDKLLSANLNLFGMTYVGGDLLEELQKGHTVTKTLHYNNIYPVLKEYMINGVDHAELLDVVCTPIVNSAGEVIGYITIYYDATERDKNRKEIQSLQNKLMLSLDSGDMSAWRYDCVTDVFTTIHGRNIGKEELELGDIFEHVYHDDKKLLSSIIDKLKSGASLKERCEVRVEYDNDVCWYRFSMAAEVNEGKVNYINGTWKDVNDEVKNREALEEAKQKAEQSEKLKMAFLANMSHEIRTPLNAIVGFSELLQHTNSAEERQQFIDIINNNNELLLRLVNDILDLSKIESGLTEYTTNPVDVVEVFHQIYFSFKKRIICDKVQLIKKSEMSDCVVKIDRNRFTQVFNNFVSNAVKYTRQGTIVMSVEYVSDGVRISVKDTGIGISEENYKYVFQRFQKFDNFEQGSGLGLAISKAITEMMGGEIGFQSNKHIGSEFWAWFPCQLISKE